MARSQDRNHSSPSGLDFLEPALTDLADEAATLSANIQRMNDMYNALDQFNEGFAAYLYALKINAFCVEWKEAPDANSWRRLQELTGMSADTSTELTQAPEVVPEVRTQPAAEDAPSNATTQEPASPAGPSAGDMTYATVYSLTPEPASKRGGRPAARGGLRRPAPTAASRKAALTAKKKRELEISKIIDTQLPLEYRGGDAVSVDDLNEEVIVWRADAQDARLVMEKVIDKLMDARNTGLPSERSI